MVVVWIYSIEDEYFLLNVRSSKNASQFIKPLLLKWRLPLAREVSKCVSLWQCGYNCEWSKHIGVMIISKINSSTSWSWAWRCTRCLAFFRIRLHLGSDSMAHPQSWRCYICIPPSHRTDSPRIYHHSRRQHSHLIGHQPAGADSQRLPQVVSWWWGVEMIFIGRA